MPRHLRLSSPVALAIVASSQLALADDTATGFAVDRFEPSERGSEWFVGESLDLRGHGRFALGAVADYSYRSLVVYNPDGSISAEPMRNLLFAHVGGSAVLWDRVRLSASLPLQAFADGRLARLGTTFYAPPPSEQGIGDLRLGADVRLFGVHGDVVTGAIGVQLWAPTGDRAQYASDGEVRIRPRAMLAGDISSFTYSAQLNVGYRGRSEVLSDGSIGSELGFAGTAGLRLAGRRLVVGPEFYGSTVVDDAFAKRSTPVEGILGAHYLASSRVRVGLGAGAGLTRGFGSPELRALLSLEWVQPADVDTDADGVLDREDACPTKAGKKTGDPKTNGCPPVEVADRDIDGVPDEADACPETVGLKTDDPKTNGCPPDGDHDGVLDEQDACPDVPGAASSDPQKNGCPLDGDGDGVFDKDDACPDVPGLKTDDPKTNGCPDTDRDKDGVPNAEDACPDTAGDKDPDPKRNGCPKALVTDTEIKILDQVKFKTASAEIEKGPESQGALEAVLKIMKEHPEIKKLRVEGHTDNRGAPATNKTLSANRAASVVKWLVAHGVDKARLKSQGFGQDRPIAENNTDEGRRSNRRVEFHIESGDGKTSDKVETKKPGTK